MNNTYFALIAITLAFIVSLWGYSVAIIQRSIALTILYTFMGVPVGILMVYMYTHANLR